ncbi:hypothetical protein ACFLWS_00190 [Chloroflexota bacterium]
MDRVYVVLDIKEGKHNEAVQNLQANPGVRWVDMLEGQWDVITAIEASNRMRLAQFLMQAMSSVENITEDVQLLPTCNGSSAEHKVESVDTVITNKIRNSKQTRYGHDGSNIPNSISRQVSKELAS